jgi:hypothetical protein
MRVRVRVRVRLLVRVRVRVRLLVRVRVRVRGRKPVVRTGFLPRAPLGDRIELREHVVWQLERCCRHVFAQVPT